MGMIDDALERPQEAMSFIYADDTALLAHRREDMRIALDTHGRLCKEFALEMSSVKCALLRNNDNFTPLRFTVSYTHLTLPPPPNV